MKKEIISITIKNNGRYTLEDVVDRPIIKGGVCVGVIANVEDDMLKGYLYADLLPEYNFDNKVVGFSIELER